MSTNNNNYELYQNTFNKVHASDELVRKVKDMTKTKAKNKLYTLKKAFTVAVAAALVVAASNVAVYAATGETLREKIAVIVIGDTDDVQIDVDKITDENGDISYEMRTITEVDGYTYDSIFAFTPDEVDFENGTVLEVESIPNDGTLVEEDGRIYLVFPSLDLKEDITEDFADGKASVTAYSELGIEQTITAEGTIDDYIVNME